jgi:hypothetical protein
MSVRNRSVAFALLALLILVSATLASAGVEHKRTFKLTSSLDGKKVLPTRTHWRARPDVPSSKVARVNFLIDRHLIWTEHQAPYFYGGNDGSRANSLVTSFLEPGRHTFTLRAVTFGGRAATDTVKARVVQAPPAPAQLVGLWTQTSCLAACNPGPVTVTITTLGWGFLPQPPQGDRWDARYLTGDKVVFGPEVITSRKSPQGAFCGVDPLFTYTYTIAADDQSFRLTPDGSDPCSDRAPLSGTWKKTG